MEFYADASMMPFEASDPLRCAYASKKCLNQRTTKLGGGLHRFCEFHRRRANANQSRVDRKRRVRRAAQRRAARALRLALKSQLTLPDPIVNPTEDADFSLDDIIVLHHLLFDIAVKSMPPSISV